MDESDENLMLRFQGGDAGAFEALLRRHRGRLFNFLLRFCGDRAAAEELCQETWLRLVAAAPRWQRRARVSSWLYTIARNLAGDAARRAAFRRTVPLDAPASAGTEHRPRPADALASDGPLPDGAADAALIRPRLVAALAALPEEQREVFLLREQAGLSFAEIAEVTRTGENTVKSRMRYALVALRKDLEAAGLAPGAERRVAP